MKKLKEIESLNYKPTASTPKVFNNGPNESLFILESIENELVAASANSELLKPTNPKQERALSHFKDALIFITKESSPMHELRRAFE